MKLFKITFLVFFISALFGTHFDAKAQLQLGIQAGINNGKIYFKNPSEDNIESINRLRWGLRADYSINDKFSLQSGLLLSTKGMKSFTETQGITSTKISVRRTTRYTYIEMPINIAYKLSNFQIYTGAYLGFGLFAHRKEDYKTVEKVGGTTKILEFTSIPSLKPAYGKAKPRNSNSGDTRESFNGLDYGLNAGIGYKLGRFLLNGGYSFGLGNIAPNYGNTEFRKARLAQHRNFTVSLSYFFGKEDK